MTTDNAPAAHTPQQATAPAPDHRSGARACECGAWSDDRGEGTGCNATTRRLYSQGHDARLASWLAQQQAAGRQVRRGDGTPVAPAEAARVIGLRYSIEDRAAKLIHVKQRKTSKPARVRQQPAEPQPEPEPVTATIKLGRWEYNASIAPSGEAHYHTKGGDQKTAPAGSYKVLLAQVGAGAE